MKRIGTEARLLDWIDQADIKIVTTIMAIANARVKARVKQSQPTQPAKPRKSKPAIELTDVGGRTA